MIIMILTFRYCYSLILDSFLSLFRGVLALKHRFFSIFSFRFVSFPSFLSARFLFNSPKLDKFVHNKLYLKKNNIQTWYYLVIIVVTKKIWISYENLLSFWLIYFLLIIITGVSLIEEGGSHCFGRNIRTCISPAVFIAEGITKVNLQW